MKLKLGGLAQPSKTWNEGSVAPYAAVARGPRSGLRRMGRGAGLAGSQGPARPPLLCSARRTTSGSVSEGLIRPSMPTLSCIGVPCEPSACRERGLKWREHNGLCDAGRGPHCALYQGARRPCFLRWDFALHPCCGTWVLVAYVQTSRLQQRSSWGGEGVLKIKLSPRGISVWGEQGLVF